MFSFSLRSQRNLKQVHPDLVKVMSMAIITSPLDFAITEGRRTADRQKELVDAGASMTMNSRHLTGHAVDVAVFIGREVRWDWPLYERLAEHIKATAQKLVIPIEWGGDWKRFKDGPHYQLPWERYP
jgi:peptidoglycan L-alanyl-D-glutamate endopeptidase CwlK